MYSDQQNSKVVFLSLDLALFFESTVKGLVPALADLYVVTAPMYLKLPLLSLSRLHDINNLNFSLWMLFSSYSRYFSLDSLQRICIFLELVLKTRRVFPSQV